MNQQTNEQAFFEVLDCVKAYSEYHEGKWGSTPPDEVIDKITKLAKYLTRLNDLTLDETGEEL